MRAGYSGSSTPINTHITQEVMTLARCMKIVRAVDGVTTKITDHDEDILLPDEVVLAKAPFHIAPVPTGPAPAEGTFSIPAASNALDGETITISSRTYTFVTGALDVTGKIKIGATPFITLTNAMQAINAGTGAGVLYASGTTAHPDVVADCVRDLAHPDYNESVLATGISARFSNFAHSTGAWFDGNIYAGSTGQPKTQYNVGWNHAMYCGITLTVPHSVTHVKIYPAPATFRHSQDGVIGGLYYKWEYGVPFTTSAKNGQLQMLAQGFNLTATTGTIAQLEDGSVSGFAYQNSDFPQPGSPYSNKEAVTPVGEGLRWGLHQSVSGTSAPTGDTSAAANMVGRTIAWKWHISAASWRAHAVPFWLVNLFSAEGSTLALYGTSQKEYTAYSDSHWWLKEEAGPYANQTLSRPKAEPITIYNGSPGTLAQHAWIRLANVYRYDNPTNDNRFFTLAEVEFYINPQTNTDERLHVVARVTGSVGNSIATTDTVTGGSWASPTLTGGRDQFYNLNNGETLKIGGHTYTFITGAFTATGQVLIGQSGGLTLQHLADAINGTASGAGTSYSTGSSADTNVTASLSTGQDGTLNIIARSTISTSDANLIGVSASALYAYLDSSTLTGGISGIYTADPGFSFSSIVSAIDQGAQGLDVQMAANTAELLLPDLRRGMWDKAVGTIFAVNWNAVSGGKITLFAGRVGQVEFDDTGYVTISIDNQMSRTRKWPTEQWSPTCRAALGDGRCKFPINDLARTFKITSVPNATTLKTTYLGHPSAFYQNGVMEILDGPNAGLGVEIIDHKNFGSSTGAALSFSGAQTRAYAWAEFKTNKFVYTKFVSPAAFHTGPLPGNIITVNGKAYTWVTGLTPTNNGDVLIYGNPGGPLSSGGQTINMQHLADAINRTASGAGVTYSTGTTVHTTVQAAGVLDGRINFQAIVPGASGNAFTLATNDPNTRLSNNTFVGGIGAGSTGVSGAGIVDLTAYDQLTLGEAFPFTVTVGTTAKIWPGCQKRLLADCVAKFHNAENFRGEPFMPAGSTIKSQ